MKSIRSSFHYVLLFVALVLVAQGKAKGQTPLPADFEHLVERGMRDWEVPGMAVAIVKDGKIFYAKGFGEKRLESDESVDEHTLFGIASVSKNITAAALALLVDEGKISWDTKIVDVIPWFALSDPWVTQQVTVRDALTHRVGIGRMIGNRLQYLSGRERDDLIFNLRYMDFEQPFRQGFVYSNMMYSVAGQVIEYVTGQTWGDFLTERLFRPLGMQANTSILSIGTTANAAWPHQYIDGQVVPIARRNWDNAAPAGAINASVIDVAKWMIMQMGEPGVYQGKRLITSEQMKEMHRPQTVRPTSDPYGTQTSYGLGWNILDYEGLRVLTHGGATDGFNTACYMVPSLDLGVVVVGNSFNRLGDALAYTVIDAFAGVVGKDWPSVYLNQYRRSFAEAASQRDAIHVARQSGTSPTLSEALFVGRYAAPAYDTIEVRQRPGGGLEIQFWGNDDVIADLEHWHFNTYRARWRNPAQREEFLYFTVGRDGAADALNFEFVLRPLLLQVGAYPSHYTRTVRFERVQ